MSFLRRPVVLMVLGVVLLGLALVAFSNRHTKKADTASATQCEFPPCRAAANPAPARGYEGAYVAADPSDPGHVVITDDNVLQGRCGFHTTFNRGRDWTDGLFDLPPGFTGCLINGPSGGHVPSGTVALGSAGRVYGVFGSAHVDDGKHESVLVATSTDGGRTFGPAKVAVRPTGPDIGLGRPLLTVVPGTAGRDTLLLSAWLCRPAAQAGAAGGTACDTAVFSKSEDGGQTYTAPVVVNDPPAGQNPSQPAVDRDGVIYETFQRRFSDGPVELYLAKSTDGGATFTTSLIDRQVQIGIQYDPAKLVVDPRTGALYTVWADSRVGRFQIFFRKSNDKGASWGERSTLLAPDQNYTGSSRSPWMSVAPNGRIDVVYYHTGPTPDVQKFDDVFWSYSVDGGENFRTRQVNDVPVDRSKGYTGPAGSMGQLGNHYPPTVSSLDDAVYVVWSDTGAADVRTNTQDVLLRRMPLVEASPP
ncbi:MAG: glycoside hydrolase [Actinomycetota bacterium]|nr:glycoside hydrolase [Actinomycetota bacterium]